MDPMRKIHIFKAGTHTDSHGVKVTVSPQDLAAMAKAYNPKLHEAPIVVGHPKNEDRAFGWVKSLIAEGANLFAIPRQVNAEFAEQVKAEAYKKVSASMYTPDHPQNPVPGGFYLRHVGFLGAMPPAVKGLQGIEFSDDQECIAQELDYSEVAAAEPAATTDQAVWEFPRATAQTTEATPAPLSVPPDAPAQNAGPGGSPEGTPPAITGTNVEQSTVTSEEAAALSATNQTLADKLAAANAKVAEQAAKTNSANHLAFAETLVAGVQLASADKALVAALLDFMEPAVVEGDTPPALVEFGEGDQKMPMADALKAWLKALPKRVEFGEQATRERAGEAADGQALDYAEGTPADVQDLDRRIQKYAKDNKTTYANAAAAVARKR